MVHAPQHIETREETNLAELSRELAGVLASAVFQSSPRLTGLLQYLVENQHSGLLKESVIATEFFKRGSDYDPKADSMVRTEIRRLRLKLAEYYMTEGAHCPGRLEIPKGAYEVVWRENSVPAIVAPVPLLFHETIRGQYRLIGLAVGSTALAVALGYAWTARPLPSLPRSVAVLPFSGTASSMQDQFSEDLTRRLSLSKSLRVTSAGSTEGFRSERESREAIGRKLAVEGVIDGSIESQPDGRIAVEVHLRDSRSGREVWSGTVSGKTQALPQLEDQLSASILSALALPSAPLPYHPKAEALDLYISGLQELRKQEGSNIEGALVKFDQATAIDPGFAAPRIATANVYLVQANNGEMSPAAALPKAEAALRKALQTDPSSADAHNTLGDLHWSRWAWKEARSEKLAAIELNPSSYAAHSSLASLLIVQGRFAEAERELSLAIELNPLWYGPQRTLAELYYYAKRYDESFAAAERIGQRFRGHSGRLIMAQVRRRQGRNAEAARYISDLAPKDVPLSSVLRAIFEGDQHRALMLLATVDQRKEYYPAWTRASIAMELGDQRQALAWLEKALAAGEPDLCSLNVDPLFDPIRNDPRCQRILSRLNLRLR